MIEGYRRVGGDDRYDSLLEDICDAMNHRILERPDVQTYPAEPAYVPDILVAIVALKNYPLQRGKFDATVDRWLDFMKAEGTNPRTGLMKNMMGIEYGNGIVVTKVNDNITLGSYIALNTYYLTFVDEEYARGQYELFKSLFLKRFPTTGFRENIRDNRFRVYIDSGPVILGLSPTGTAFGIGPCTYFGDFELRRKLLRTESWPGPRSPARGRPTTCLPISPWWARPSPWPCARPFLGIHNAARSRVSSSLFHLPLHTI